MNGYGLTQYGVDGLTRFYSAVNDDSSPPASLGLVDLGLEINQLTFHTIKAPRVNNRSKDRLTVGADIWHDSMHD